MTIDILILLLAFQAKHLIADYYLQFPYMYENKGKPTGWIKPLMDHSIIHGIGTSIILIMHELYMPTPMWALLLPLFDIGSHFIVDRIKAIQPEGPDTKKFWTNLGWDQLIHHTVGIIIIFYITVV